MAIYKEDIATINLEAGNIFRSFVKHTIGTADSAADRFGIRVMRGEEEVDLSECSCYGYFRDPHGNNIALTSQGTVDGNVAYVTLPQACYNYEGQFCLSIKLIGGGVTGTMRIVDGVIDNTNTGSAAAPTGTVPTYSEILSQYDAMVAATAAANGCIAETFDATKAYKAGQYVINSGALYRLTADHAANTTWANTSKVEVKFGNELSDVKSAINNILVDETISVVWEQGYIRSDGSIGSDNAICVTDMLVSDGTRCAVWVASGYKASVAHYSSAGSYLGRAWTPSSTGEHEFTIPSGDKFRIQVSIDSGTLAPSGITSSIYKGYKIAPDTTLSESGKAADAKATGDAIEEIKTMFSDVVSFSNNLLNPADVTEHAYISPTGLQTSSNYANWFATGYIDVNGETSLQSSIPIKSIIIYNSDGTVDNTNSYNGLNTSATLPFSIPSTARKIRISAYMADLNYAMINYGTTVLPYQKYGAEINQDALKENPVLAKLNSHTTTENYLTSCKQALKKDVLLSYFATFTGFTSLKIGFTTSDNYATGYLDYIEITGTNFILHRKNQNDITWTHGLTLKDYVSVHITFDFSMNFSAVVKTNGGEFAKTNYFYLGASYYPFAILEATGNANNNLSFSCADFQKNVLLFGDSYFSNASTRWLYYLTAEQQKNLCINGYAGESSPSAISDCETLFGLCTPKFAVWCLGMNDGSDANDTTPSTQWLSNVQKFINFCAEKNIQPILATIPSVPTINNRAKSAWVRESGYRYIDFAYAVNNGNDGSWYDNMLSGDGVHPDVAGAKALYDRAITDFPELLID